MPMAIDTLEYKFTCKMLHCFYPLQVIMPSPLTFQEHGTLDWSPLAPRSCGALGGGSTWGHWHHSSEAHSDGWKNSGSGLREWEEGTSMLNCAAELCTIQQSCLQIVLDLWATLILYFAFIWQNWKEIHYYLSKNTTNTNYANINNPQYLNCTNESTPPV